MMYHVVQRGRLNTTEWSVYWFASVWLVSASLNTLLPYLTEYLKSGKHMWFVRACGAPFVLVADRTAGDATSDVMLTADRWIISREAAQSFWDWSTPSDDARRTLLLREIKHIYSACSARSTGVGSEPAEYRLGQRDGAAVSTRLIQWQVWIMGAPRFKKIKYFLDFQVGGFLEYNKA